MTLASGTSGDLFASVRAATDAHRRRHGCGAYPYSEGPLLSVIAAAADARRIVELGTALGYTALSLAHGAVDAQIDTIERDAEHVRLARDNFAAAGCAQRITVHEGDFDAALARLSPPYDMAFFDGFAPSLAYLAQFCRLLRRNGVLVSTNLDVGRADRYRAALEDPAQFLSSFAAEDGRTAISIKRG